MTVQAACLEVKCLSTEKAAEGWGLSGADAAPSPWPPAPSAWNTGSQGPWAGAGVGWGRVCRGPGPRSFPQNPLSLLGQDPQLLGSQPGACRQLDGEIPPARGVPGGVATTFSRASLSPLSLSPCWGHPQIGGGRGEGEAESREAHVLRS